MITYIKMKIMEHRIKYALYSTITTLLNEQKDIIELISKLYVALKDIPMEDLQKELVHAIAEIVHEENKKTEE